MKLCHDDVIVGVTTVDQSAALVQLPLIIMTFLSFFLWLSHFLSLYSFLYSSDFFSLIFLVVKRIFISLLFFKCHIYFFLTVAFFLSSFLSSYIFVLNTKCYLLQLNTTSGIFFVKRFVCVNSDR